MDTTFRMPQKIVLQNIFLLITCPQAHNLSGGKEAPSRYATDIQDCEWIDRVDHNTWFQLVAETRRATRNADDPINLRQKAARLEARWDTFSTTRVVEAWNLIPSTVKNARTVNILKESLQTIQSWTGDSHTAGDKSGVKMEVWSTTGCRHFLTVFRIRIHVFFGLPDPDPLVRCMDPDPSIIMKK